MNNSRYLQIDKTSPVPACLACLAGIYMCFQCSRHPPWEPPGQGRGEQGRSHGEAITSYLQSEGEREREMFYLTTHSTHFIYSYMASDIWLRTILIVRKETRCCHIGYSYRLTARVILYAPPHRQDRTYHSLCYTGRGALAGMRNSSMGVIKNTAILQVLWSVNHACRPG